MGKKRGNDEGSIYKRGDTGVWIGAITLSSAQTGKPRRKTITGKTRAEVAKKLAALKTDQERGLPIDGKRQTLEVFLKAWLRDVVTGAVRPRTHESYEATVRLHIVPVLGRIELSKLTAQHVSALLQAKAAEGLSARSVRNVRTVLRIALNMALRWDLVARNVVNQVPPPKMEKHEVRAFTPEQARQFLEAIKGDRLEGLYVTALATGLRQGELLALHWTDVDLDAATLRVRYSVQRIGKKLTLVQPKSDKSRRTIDLPEVAIVALRAHRLRQLEERLFVGVRWNEQGLVFPSTVGTPMEKGNLIRVFHNMLRKAGLPAMRFHDLRHCFASLLLAQNVHPKVVQELLGHSQIALTLDLYSHVMPSTKKDAAHLMNGLLAASEVG